MLLSIEHRLAFAYDVYISESFLELRVQPKTDVHQTLHTFTLAVGPPTRVDRYTDWNENVVHHFNVARYHNRIEVVSRSIVATHPAGAALDAATDVLPLGDPPYPLGDFLRLRGPVERSATLEAFVRELAPTPAATLGEVVRAVGSQIQGRFTYQKDVTRYDSTTEDFLRLGAGVCQDFTHLMLAVLRVLGIPARYVSGYLHLTPRNEPAQSHAWIEFWSPTRGWVPFDPTHDCEIDERYVVVAHGRDYDDVPPNKGIYRGNAHETLRAEVRTRPTSMRRTSAPSEAVEALDVPVFTEIQARRTDHDVIVLVEQAAQQQQQRRRRPRSR
jgi:transglutaminase-like putative cysteine protease